MGLFVKKTDFSGYRYFEDAKQYQFPVDLSVNLSRVTKNTLPSGRGFWFDPQRYRVASDDEGIYVQWLKRGDFGNLITRIILNRDGLKIEFSRKGGACLDRAPPKDGNGEFVWQIEDIGCSLYCNTVHDDKRAGIKRPHSERAQISTNASKFISKAQQDQGIEFVKIALATFGTLPHLAISGEEMPGRVEFSTELEKRIADGEFIVD